MFPFVLKRHLRWMKKIAGYFQIFVVAELPENSPRRVTSASLHEQVVEIQEP